MFYALLNYQQWQAFFLVEMKQLLVFNTIRVITYKYYRFKLYDIVKFKKLIQKIADVRFVWAGYFP